MSLSYIWPVVIDFHGDPSFDWKATGDPAGIADVSIAGRIPFSTAEQLRELAANADREITVGGRSGALVYVYAGDDLLRTNNGFYLLVDAHARATKKESLMRLADVDLSLAHIGDLTTREVFIARSARPKGNTVGVTAEALVVAPFRPDDVDGDRFVVPPGGAFFTRPYDPASAHVIADLVPDDLRALGLYQGAVTSSTDAIGDIALPPLEQVGDTAPGWLIERGGEVQCWNRRIGREVFGPLHSFAADTDLLIRNGLVRAWPGPRGLPPFLHVEGLADGEWRQEGYLLLAEPTGDDVMLSARLDKLTAEEAVVIFSVRNKGDVAVRLRRGARGFEVTHGAGFLSAPVTSRVVRWAGVPPWTRLESATQGPAAFDRGIETQQGEGATWADPSATWADPSFTWSGRWPNPDLRLRWPGRTDRYTLSWTWKADEDAVSDHAGGQMTIADDDHHAAVRVHFDEATNRFVATIGATTIQSSPQTYLAGDVVRFFLRVSPTEGLAFSVKSGSAALEHAKNAGVTSPGTDVDYRDLYLGVSLSAWGDDAWGDGSWGAMSYPDGVTSDLMVFEDYLSDDDVAELAAPASRFDGLAEVGEGRLIWYASLDPRPIIHGSTAPAGNRYESTGQDGSTRSPDLYGQTKGVAVLTSPANGTDGLGWSAVTDEFEVYAYLASTATGDDLADHHAQYAAESAQELRVR